MEKRRSADLGPIELVNLRDAVAEVLRGLNNRATVLGAEISIGELPSVEARRAQVLQLFHNLIDNALKYAGGRPPVVRIGSAKAIDGWCVWVSDKGIGIDRDKFEHIFDLRGGRQSPSGQKRLPNGLAVCQRIVESHGGRIWVESNATEGACFYFTIPGSQ